MMYFSFYFVTPLLPLYLRDVFHADKAMIGLVLSGYSIAALVIRFFSGYIDVLPSQRRGEGIGYWGLSNNFAMAIGPTLSLWLYNHYDNYNILFTVSLITSLIGFFINTTIDCKYRPPVKDKKKMLLDRFVLLKGWSQGICIALVAFAYGVLSTYIAIYSQDVLNITTGTGTFFMLFAIGLIMSRFVGVKSLSKGYVVRNATYGVIFVAIGYSLFAFWQNLYGYYISALVIGFGQGSMYPAVQTMFLNMAPNEQRGTANSTILTSWDLGLGLGIILGGYVAEHLGGYMSVFLLSAIVTAVSVIFFIAYAKNRYMKSKMEK